MSQVVQATCPGCKTVLRIPAAWLEQSFRCKHCGTVIHARAKKSAAAKPARPAARPAAPPAPAPAGDNPFAFEEEAAENPVKKYRRRTRGGAWKGLVVVVVVLGLAGGAGYFAWPHLKPLLDPPAAAQGLTPPEPDDSTFVPIPPFPEAGRPEPAPPEPPKVGGSKPVVDTGKKPEPPRPVDTGKRPAPVVPVVPPIKPSRPADLPSAAGGFPRRALVVSINNYLYANPVEYVEPTFRGGTRESFLERLTLSLKVPRDQVLELSDASPRAPRPMVEPVVSDTINYFLLTARPQDRVLLLLVGHLVDLDGEVFLVPQNGDLETKETLIPMKGLYEKLGACPARQKVLIVDTCRLNPTRGVERTGPGAMSEKLDAFLAAPPPGVQVWSACVKDQYSYEFDDSETRNGVFLDALYESLRELGRGPAPRPEEPLPVVRLVDEVNRRLKAQLGPLGKVQTSRLAGTEPAEGAAYDPKEPAAAVPKLASAPMRPGGVTDVATIKEILKDISFPPLKVGKDSVALSAEALPPFPRETVLPYLADDKEKTPLREAVMKARDILNKMSDSKVLRDGYRAPANEAAFKREVERHQKEASELFLQLGEATEMMEAAKDHRKKETKRWQVTYDYVLARLKAQTAYLMEYQAMLGQLRRELPARDPKVHGGWRLASQPDPVGDGQAKKLAAEARKLLVKIVQDHPDTPWAVVAKRDKASALGLEWQPTK